MPPPSSSRSGGSSRSSSSSSSKSSSRSGASSSSSSASSSSSSSSRSKTKSSSSSSSSRSSSHRNGSSSSKRDHLTIDVSPSPTSPSPSSLHSISERDPNAKSLRMHCTTNTWKRIMILLMFMCGGLMYVLFHTRLGETLAASMRDRGSHGWMQTQMLLHKDQSANPTTAATTTPPTQPSATLNVPPQVDAANAIASDSPSSVSSKSLLDSGSASKLQRLYDQLREKGASKPTQTDASNPITTNLPVVPSDAPEVPEGLPYELPSSSFSTEKMKEAYQAMDGAAPRYAGAPVVVQGVAVDTSEKDISFKRDVIDVPKPPNYGKWNKLVYTPHPDPEVNQLLIESQKPTKSLIPKIVHFVFGLKDPRDVRYSLSEYLVMKAARDVIQAEKIYVHYVYEPGSSSAAAAPVAPANGAATTNPSAANETPVYTAGASSFWWDKFVSETSKDVLILNKLNPDKIGKVFGWPIKSYAHKADIVRLEALMTYGGIYLDMDMLVVKPLDHLLRFEMVMGEETTSDEANATPHGLCNAFIMARRESFFLREWMKLHRMYEDERWAWHSVRLPLKLAGLYPNTIKTIPANQLFKPYMDEKGQHQLYLSEDFNIDNNIGVHLWSGGAKYRTETDLNALCALKTTYGKLARMVLDAGAQPEFKYSCKKITPTVVPAKIGADAAEEEKARNARTQF